MKKDFWLERWEREEIGFHQDEINPYLRLHWPDLRLPRDSVVFVPMCGKSRDMRWLREQGHGVLGVELSAIAVRAFFEENGTNLECLGPRHDNRHQVFGGKFDCYKSDGISILCGDFFDLNKADLANVTAVYDRASLIALPPDMRESYASHLVSILPPATQILLITVDYPQPEMQGPPFSVTAVEVEALYRGHADVRLLLQADVLEQNPRFRERGLSRLRENILLLKLN